MVYKIKREGEGRRKITMWLPDHVYQVIQEKADMWTRGDIKIWLRYAGYCHDPAKLSLEDLFKEWKERNQSST